MKKFTLALMLFVFQRRLRLDGGIGEPIHIAELEPPRAVHVILQG